MGLRVSDISTRPALSGSAVSISGTGSSSSSPSSSARARKPKLRHRPWSVVSEQILHACGTGDCLDWSVSVRGGDDNDRTRVKVDEGTWRLMLNDFCHPTTGGMWRTRREAIATMHELTTKYGYASDMEGFSISDASSGEVRHEIAAAPSTQRPLT